MLTNEYLKRVYDGLAKRNANEPEFLQAVREVLEGIGVADCRVDTRVGRRILGPLDLEHAPMFGIAARKP